MPFSESRATSSAPGHIRQMQLAEERDILNYPGPFHISDIGYIFVRKFWSPERESDVAGS